MAEASYRHPIRVPLIVGFSLLLLAVSVMGIFVYLDFGKVSLALRTTNYDDSYHYHLQRMLQDLYRAETSVQAFTITHDPRILEGFYITYQMSPKRDTHLLSLAKTEVLQADTRALIGLLDQKFDHLQGMIGVASQGMNLSEFFERLSFAAKGQDSLAWAAQKQATGRIQGLIDANKLDRMFPPTLPQVEMDSLTDSVTLSQEAFFALQGYRSQTLTDLRQMTQKGKEIDKSIRRMVRKIEDDLKQKTGDLVSGLQEKFIDTEKFFIVFSIATVIMGLVFLAYIINTIDRNRRLQSELTDQKARAERLAQAKEEFLANMSHEIRTPMNAVIGFSEQLGQTSLQPTQQRLLEPLRNSAQYLLALINDILDISKLDSGNFRLESSAFRLAELTKDVQTIFDRQAQGKGLTLICDVDEAVPPILVGDALRLKQMLYNLVSNALKFTDEGEVELRIERDNQPATGQTIHLHLAVRDTGIGIPPEKRDDMFDKFIQAESHTSRRYGGTGLGLAITKRLAELMDGRISLESELGHGTTVHLHLPLLVASESELTPGLEGVPLDPAPLKGQRILLVDDEMYNRELAEYILTKWEVEVVSAENGQVAVDYLAKDQDFGLILMDLHMPQLNGLDATRQIKEGLNLDLPILAMTATATTARLREAREAGMDGHLIKPFREAELLSLLLRLLHLPERPLTPDRQPVAAAPSLPEGDPQSSHGYSLTAMYRLAHNDERFVKRMLQLFVERSADTLEALQQAATQQDWNQVGMHAHKLIPPCRHLGLEDLVQRLKRIEIDCEQGKAIPPDTVAALVDDLHAVSTQVKSDAEKLTAKS
jgi:signal transduction histidine kinase/HPt (histidine-containing phosphotransfer) domain-containing protein/ActR/RegA family two-component response regulator